MRLAKAISAKGYCSRRNAEELILNGKVMVNKQLITDVVTFVADDDEIEIIGQQTLNIKPKLWLYHKPVGVITTASDPQNRRTVFADLPFCVPEHLVCVGRLDINSQGLLLVTNSKKLAQFLESPVNKFKRVYKVRVWGQCDNNIFSITKGITIDGINYKPVAIELVHKGVNSWYQMTLSEGKNREIRKILQHFGLSVNRLIRTDYGPFSLDGLNPGQAKECQIPQNMLDLLQLATVK
jgi:23S rRNA pseudouridine2605 synthase